MILELDSTWKFTKIDTLEFLFGLQVETIFQPFGPIDNNNPNK